MIIEMTRIIARSGREVGLRDTPSAGDDVSKVIPDIKRHGVVLVPGPEPYAYPRRRRPLHGVPATSSSSE